MRQLMLTIVILSLLLGVSTAPVSAESNPIVMMYEIQGNAHVPSEKILGVISNSRIGEPLDPQRVRADMDSISELGYFADVRSTTEKFFDGVKVIFTVVENPLFKEVRITGLTKINPEELKPFFTQKPGEVFCYAAFQSDLSNAIKFCQDKKKFYVQPKGNGAAISPDGIVELKLVELKYGKTIIVGLQNTKEKVVLRELPFHEGDIINLNDLRTSISNLGRLQLFESILPKFVASNSPDSLDFVLELKETRNRSINPGLVYSSKTQELGGSLEYYDPNLMGLGESISLNLNISKSEKDIEMSFYEPWLDENHTSFGLSMWNRSYSMSSTMHSWLGPGNNNIYDMSFLRTGISVSLGRPVWKDTTASVALTVEKNNVDHYYDRGTKNDGPPVTLAPREFWDNSIQFQLTGDKRQFDENSFVNGGLYWQGSYAVSGRYLGGYFDYQKSMFDLRGYQMLAPNLIVGSRLKLAMISGCYPDYDQLYLGGDNLLRGYTNQQYDGANSQLIGNTYWLSNTELRYRMPFNKNIELVTFFDMGQTFKNGSASSLKNDYGLGLRLIVPLLGCIRLDEAWNSQNESRFVFSINELF